MDGTDLGKAGASSLSSSTVTRKAMLDRRDGLPWSLAVMLRW